MKDKSAVVIGGGVIGVCCAYYLALRGWQVTLLEKTAIAAGSSYGNMGLLVPEDAVPLAAPGVIRQGLGWMLDAESPFYIRPRLDADLLRWLWRFRAACNDRAFREGLLALLALGELSHALYDDLLGKNNLDVGYERKGWLYVFKRQQALEHAQEEAHLLAEFGIEWQMLDAAAVQAMEPSVQPDIIGGVYHPNDAHLIPDRFTYGMAALAEKQGVRIITCAEVLRLELSGRRVTKVFTTHGDFSPDQIVLAAGVWSPMISRDLKIRLPVQGAKGYSITVKRPSNAPKIPLHLSERRTVITPMGDRLRLGGTLELAGFDFSINQRRIEAIRRAVPEYLVDMGELEVIEIWRGLRPLTPDSLPIIGRSRRVENLVIAAGHGMLGMTHAPATGKLVAQITSGDKPDIHTAPYSPDRFA